MGATNLFERLAADTWERLDQSRLVGLRFGEEGMTDLLLLEIMRHRWSSHSYTTVMVRGKTPKHLEKLYGTDWEWWIGNSRRGWLRYALQAKIIDLRTHRYNGLAHSVGSVPQVDLLEKYARTVGAMPLYVFYNHSNQNLAGLWQCCRTGTAGQFGCTVTTIDVVRAKLAKRGGRTFRELHSEAKTLPWRCLVKCPKMRSWGTHPYISSTPSASTTSPMSTPRYWYPALPRFFARMTTPQESERTSKEVSEREVWAAGIAPQRLVLTTIKESSSDG